MGSKKTKTEEKSTSVSSSTSTPTNPEWITNPLQKYTTGVAGLLDKDPASFVAGAGDIQQGVFNKAATLGGGDQTAGQGAFASAGSALNGVLGARAGPVSAASNLDGLDAYGMEYARNVVDPTLADWDVEAGRTRAAQAAAGARNKAFGGSRFGVQEAQTEGELARGRATTEAQLLDTAFTRAAGLSENDAQRRQSAALANQASDNTGYGRDVQIGGIFGNLGSAESAAAQGWGENDRANLALQSDIGGIQRGITQDQLNAPLGAFGAIGDLFAKGQYGLFNGESVNGTETRTGTGTTTENPGLLATAGKAVKTGAQLAKLFSDERLKRDIQTSHYDDHGRRWVTYRYHDDDPGAAKRLGVLAQEVMDTDPDAVSVDKPSGYFKVDYSQLDGAPA